MGHSRWRSERGVGGGAGRAFALLIKSECLFQREKVSVADRRPRAADIFDQFRIALCASQQCSGELPQGGQGRLFHQARRRGMPASPWAALHAPSAEQIVHGRRATAVGWPKRFAADREPQQFRPSPTKLKLRQAAPQGRSAPTVAPVRRVVGHRSRPQALCGHAQWARSGSSGLIALATSNACNASVCRSTARSRRPDHCQSPASPCAR